jgi:large subunit ribosomal protein L15e
MAEKAETKEKKTKAKAPKEAKKAEPQKSVKGFYHYIKRAWKKPSEEFIADRRKKMIDWRAGDRVAKLEKPSRLDKARALGYKAKKGIVVYRVTLPRGGRAKARPTTKRRSKRFSVMKILRMNYRWVAEQRAQTHHRNLEVLNSYPIGKCGRFYFFEVIMVDPNMPEIKSDKDLNWICRPENRNRTSRGLTSAAKKSRGMRTKSHNLKVRPSLRSWGRKGR